MFDKQIKTGIYYLSTSQKKDGSFLSLSSKNLIRFNGDRIYRSTFSSSLILSCLNHLEETPIVKDMKKKIVAFLLSQKSDYWSFNYWVRKSKEAKAMPYPDDLDDTFCALSALYEYDLQLIDGSVMAQIVEILTATEVKEGGPYRTWLVNENISENWKDIDLVVNSNIAYFLSLQDVELPHLNLLIESAIKGKKLHSPYYPSEYPIIYFISRIYKGKYVKKLRQYLLAKRKHGYWGNPLYTSLAILSLLNLDASQSEVIDGITYLVNQQSEGWKPFGFCNDPALDGRTYYSGSSALTTAFCLAALSQYSQNNLKQIQNQPEPSKEVQIYKQIIKVVKQDILHLGKDLREESFAMMEKILKIDRDKPIVLLPYHFRSALGKNGESLKDALVIKLGAANLFGWIAYTIFDNFLDNEADPKTLSTATFALRRLTSLFDSILSSNREFQNLFISIMDDLDTTNMWEVKHCRTVIYNGRVILKNLHIPRFGSRKKLAQKSLGHALGPLAIMFSLGFTKNSPEVKNLFNFFANYLIARQLNDDAHDWEEDLKKGQINYVGALLLGKAKKTYPMEVDIVPTLQELFCNDVIKLVSTQILTHTKLAKDAINNLQLINDHSLFDNLLFPLEKSAEKAITEQKKAIAFIQSYESKNNISYNIK